MSSWPVNAISVCRVSDYQNDRAGIVFICSGIAAYVISYLQGFKDNEKATNLDEVSFRTSSFFHIASVIVIMILGVFYATWW